MALNLCLKCGRIQVARLSLHLLLFVGVVVIRERVLIHQILGDEVPHVRLGFGELHLIYARSQVILQKSLASKHCRKLLVDALEDFDYRG